MTEFSENDQHWMRQALELAMLGQGYVEPNPMVGCVIVRDGMCIGKGYHRKFGEPHAEINAIKDANRDLTGATAFVTLEPCCHYGKTPPCVSALIAAGIERAVIATKDPNPLVAGGGIETLQSAGIRVQLGLMEREANALNAPFVKRMVKQLPWVIAKWAMSLDGKIATRSGHSQWISNAESRAEVHRLRGRVDGIMVGIETAIADDPRLTARPGGARVAARIVLDSCLRLPVESQLAQTARNTPVLLFAGPSADDQKARVLEQLGCEIIRSQLEDRQMRLQEALRMLSSKWNFTNLLVEGGSQVLGGLFESHMVDQCEVFIGPKIIGGQSAPSPIAGLGNNRLDDAPEVEVIETLMHGHDLHLSCKIRYQGH
jgi:diaminohydroxyphosphoribosylaminopyrimidine deaminase / 5-amino-6-(5-phosphoribosylamino)uracil reductase